MHRLMAQLKRLMIAGISAFIPNRVIRKRVRHFLKDLQLVDVVTAINFRRLKIDSKSVLIIELNPCHGEVIPGYIDYFRRLGYAVDVLVNQDVARENPLVRMEEGTFRLFSSKPTGFSLFLSPAALERYACVFLATAKSYVFPKTAPAVIDKFPQLLNHRNLICVEHDLADVAWHREEELLRDNRVVTLGRFTKGILVNPHVFGTIAITAKSTPVRFLVVCATGRSREGLGLIQTLLEVVKVVPTIQIVIVGLNTFSVPDVLRSQVVIKGRLSFEALFDEVEQASFILALLNPENPLHERYLTTSVSGALQLSYGFRKPLVIQRRFADHYGFTSSTAVVYEQDLRDAMLVAIGMSLPDYAAMQGELGRTADVLYEESLSNLRQMAEGMGR